MSYRSEHVSSFPFKNSVHRSDSFILMIIYKSSILKARDKLALINFIARRDGSMFLDLIL